MSNLKRVVFDTSTLIGAAIRAGTVVAAPKAKESMAQIKAGERAFIFPTNVNIDMAAAPLRMKSNSMPSKANLMHSAQCHFAESSHSSRIVPLDRISGVINGRGTAAHRAAPS